MTKPRNRSLFLTVLLLLGAAGAALRPAGEAERAGWRADLADLEAHVSRAYANLEWQVRRGRVDPRALHDSTVAALARGRCFEFGPARLRGRCPGSFASSP